MMSSRNHHGNAEVQEATVLDQGSDPATARSGTDEVTGTGPNASVICTTTPHAAEGSVSFAQIAPARRPDLPN
jgi:hypothetical protein